jgi:hypothetical protein
MKHREVLKAQPIKNISLIMDTFQCNIGFMA